MLELLLAVEETATSWLTPELVGSLLALVLTVLRLIAVQRGWTKTAVQLGEAQTTVGAVVRGVESWRTSGRVDPDVFKDLTATIQASATAQGVEPLLQPIVKEVQAAVLAERDAATPAQPAGEAVRRGTDKFERERAAAPTPPTPPTTPTDA